MIVIVKFIGSIVVPCAVVSYLYIDHLISCSWLFIISIHLSNNSAEEGDGEHIGAYSARFDYFLYLSNIFPNGVKPSLIEMVNQVPYCMNK